MTWLVVLLSVGLVSAIPLLGLALIRMRPSTLRRLLLPLVSFAVGTMLGGAFLHLLPEAVARLGAGIAMSLYVLLGFLSFFLLERLLARASLRSLPRVAALNLLGDALHNLVDGMVIAAAYTAGLGVGIVITVAVALHELPQEVGDLGILIYHGIPVRRAVYYNLLSALSAVAGAVVTLTLGSRVAGFGTAILPVAAGALIYIATADLVPTLARWPGRKPAFAQVTLMLLGIGLTALPALLE
jgi:zinc and cadmium transporter